MCGIHRMRPLARPLGVFPPYLGTSFIHRVISCKEDRDEPEELGPHLLGHEGEKKERPWILGCKGRRLETWSPKTERRGLIARKPRSLRNKGMGPDLRGL